MEENKYKKLTAELAEKNVQLVAVSKYQSDEAVIQLYNYGQRIFGENKVQDLVAKQARFPNDIAWHMIGHLQSNKVKYIAPFIAMIHSVDNLKLLQEINKQAAKHNRIIPCMLQVHIASEETKFGFSSEEIIQAAEFIQNNSLPYIEIVGLMGMASNTIDKAQIDSEFAALHTLFTKLKTAYFSSQSSFRELSMGMSSDYEIAIKNGSTFVRLGSILFK